MSSSHPRVIIMTVAVAASVLAGCTSRNTEPEPAALAAPAPALAEADLPRNAGCAAAIARTRAIVEDDIVTGNLDRPVGARFVSDLDGADAACAARREPEAMRLLAAAKVRYGYR